MSNKSSFRPLLMLDGYADWNKHVDMFEPDRFGKKKKRREIGHPVTNPEPDKIEMRNYTGWALPHSFCCDCGRTDITPKRGLDGTVRINPGIRELDEPMPEIDLTKGDVILYFTCHDCEDSNLWQKKILPFGVSREMAETERINRRERNVIEWIKAAKLRGDKPTVGRR